MAFPVAVQSAIFYIMACTPCTSARGRYRAKKRFDKERKERAALEEEEPQLYRQPSPFGVNPYWTEEIMMGPSLPKKGRGNKNQSQHKLMSAGQDSSVATQSSLAFSHQGTSAPNTAVGEGSASAALAIAATTPSEQAKPGAPPPPDTGRRKGTVAASPVSATPVTTTTTAGAAGASHVARPTPSPTLIPDDARSMSLLETTATATTSIDGWNHKRYQREDEELWGNEPSRTHKFMDAIVKAGSSAGRLLESTLGKERNVTDEDRVRFYAPTMIYPPVNDYHPPVVSNKPTGKGALLWMLQPPPPAKVMEGKVPVSRSTSVASSLNAMGGGRRLAAGGESDVSLSRRMAREARLRQGEPGASGMTSSNRAKPSSYSSTEELAGHGIPRRSAGGGADSRPMSRQRNNLQAMRNRSDSLASSLDDAGWSSDDQPGLLKTRWRFPTAVPAAVAEDTGVKEGDGSALANAENGQAAATKATQGAAQAQQLRAPRAKLETIVSSDVVNKLPGAAQASSSKASKDNIGKENTRMADSSASMDSGLALTS